MGCKAQIGFIMRSFHQFKNSEIYNKLSIMCKIIGNKKPHLCYGELLLFILKTNQITHLKNIITNEKQDYFI